MAPACSSRPTRSRPSKRKLPNRLRDDTALVSRSSRRPDGVELLSLLHATLSDAPPGLFPHATIEAWRIDPGVRVDPPAVGFECRLGTGAHPVDLGLVARPDPGLPTCVDATFFEWDQLPSQTLRSAPLRFHRFGSGIAMTDAAVAISKLAPHGDLGELSVLPADTRVTDVGLLDARAPGWLRIGLLVRLATARDLLARAGWEDAGAQLDALLELLASRFERIRVQVDLAPLRFVGVELVADQSPRGEGWRELLELLVLHGACAPERAIAVQRWPASLPTQLPGVGACALHRTISHLKVSRAASGYMQAKAYLFARQADLW